MDINEIKLTCPNCGGMIEASEQIYYIDLGEDEVTKDSNLEWECKNGCLFDDDIVEEIDALVEKLISIGSKIESRKTGG